MARHITASLTERVLDDVIEALREVRRFEFVVSTATGTVGTMHTALYRGAPFLELDPRFVLEILVPDDDAPMVADLIGANASADTSDALIWIVPLADVVDVRTGSRSLEE